MSDIFLGKFIKKHFFTKKTDEDSLEVDVEQDGIIFAPLFGPGDILAESALKSHFYLLREEHDWRFRFGRFNVDEVRDVCCFGLCLFL